MNIVRENRDQLNIVLKVHITPEDYQESFDKALRDVRKKVRLPGFRPGMVPTGVVRKMHGKALLAEELNKILSNSIPEYIESNSIEILGSPLPADNDKEAGDWDNPKEFTFTYDLGLAPSFEIKLSEKDKFGLYTILIDDKFLDKEVGNLARRYGKMSESLVAGEKDMLIGDFTQVDKRDNKLPDGHKHSSTISIEFVEDRKMKAKLIGLKPGDELVLDARKISSGEVDKASMLGVKLDEIDALGNNFNFRVNEIKHIEPAELNQELFDKLFGPGEVTTVAELREKVKTDLARMFEVDSDRMFKRDVSEKLMEKLKLKLPDSFLKKFIKGNNDKELTDEQIEKDYENYAESLKWQLIENKIVKENNLKVTAEEAVEHVKDLLVKQYAQYGMPAPEAELLTSSAARVLENRDEAKRVYENLFGVKVLQFFKDTVRVKPKEVTYDEFAKLAKGKK